MVRPHGPSLRGDKLIIATFALQEENSPKEKPPILVFVDGFNRIVKPMLVFTLPNDFRLNHRPMRIEQGNLRPPSEARSLLIRVVRNCPWNKCKFCPAYKGEVFSIRSPAELIADIQGLAADPANHYRRSVFLQDADALSAPVESLVEIIEAIRASFPTVERITTYSRSTLLNSRKLDALKRLRQAGLNRIHVGMESGCNEVLDFMDKGSSYEKHRNASLKAKEAGFEICCYFMPGLGGKRWSEQHANESGRLVREIEPHHVRLRTCFVLQGTALAEDYRAGHFEPLSEEETVQEIRSFLSHLSATKTELISDHRVNLLLELRGRLPDDYGRLMGIIDRYLGLSAEGKSLFETGRRRGILKKLDEMSDAATMARLLQEMPSCPKTIPVPKSLLY